MSKLKDRQYLYDRLAVSPAIKSRTASQVLCLNPGADCGIAFARSKNPLASGDPRQVVAAQMEQAIQENGYVPAVEDESVPVRPRGICRVVRQVAIPQRNGHLCHDQRSAGMPRVSLRHCVHVASASRALARSSHCQLTGRTTIPFESVPLSQLAESWGSIFHRRQQVGVLCQRRPLLQRL